MTSMEDAPFRYLLAGRFRYLKTITKRVSSAANFKQKATKFLSKLDRKQYIFTISRVYCIALWKISHHCLANSWPQIEEMLITGM